MGYIHHSLFYDPGGTLLEFCLMEITVRTKWDFAGKKSASPSTWHRMRFSRMLLLFPLCFGSFAPTECLWWFMAHGHTLKHTLFWLSSICVSKERIDPWCSFSYLSIFMLLILNILLIRHRQFTLFVWTCFGLSNGLRQTDLL